MIFDGYLICSDCDGTLTDNEGRLSRENAEAIRYFQSRGGRFTLATGRFVNHLEKYQDSLQVNAPVVALNGTMLYDLEQNKEYAYWRMLRKEGVEVLRYLEKHWSAVDECWINTGMENGFVFHPGKDDLEVFAAQMPEEWYKIVFVQKAEITPLLQADLRHVFGNVFRFESSWPNGLEMQKIDAGKGLAVQWLKKSYKGAVHTVICVGDAENDLTMMEAADISYAVGNGIDAVKAAADRVTVSNEEHAIAHIIRELEKEILSKEENGYHVRKMNPGQDIQVTVPGSKSITNRALLLAALSKGLCTLKGVLFSADSRAFLGCLKSLGFDVTIDEEQKQVTILGTGGCIPNRQASIHVGSAGTAARFLTVFLALAGGDYCLDATAQMRKRPMEPLITTLREAGIRIDCLEQEGHFPFEIHSRGILVEEVSIDTTVSSQFASALMMSGVLAKKGLRIRLTGERTMGSYIKMTLAMMEQFGIPVEITEGLCHIPGGVRPDISEYQIEPDVSGAGYFFAMAPLLQSRVLVKNVHLDSMQGDIRFLDICREMGCVVTDTPEGVVTDGSGVKEYPGVNVCMKDFSDQTLTLAAIAPFATGITKITGIGHIRKQESDRLAVILTELARMGIACEELPKEDGLLIHPGALQPAEIETYEDHRVAMAFTLPGLRMGNITIKNPGCCAKTFENYFELIDGLLE